MMNLELEVVDATRRPPGQKCKVRVEQRLGAVRLLLTTLVLLACTACSHAPSPLHAAVLAGDEVAVRRWIEQGRSVEITYDEAPRGVEGNYARRLAITPLMVAARSGHLAIVRLLTEAGADIHATSDTQMKGEPRTAFDEAVGANRVDIALYLWSRGDGSRLGGRLSDQIASTCRAHCDPRSGVDASTNMALFLLSIASEEQRSDGLGKALCMLSPASVQAEFIARYVKPFPKGTLPCVAFTPPAKAILTWAQREAMVVWMLSQGAEIDYAGSGYSALMGAASTQDLQMLQFLLHRGANPNAANSYGLTALGAAAGSCAWGNDSRSEQHMQDRLRIVEELLKAGADASVYTQEVIRRRVPLLSRCCERAPAPAAQRRICEVFKL